LPVLVEAVDDPGDPILHQGLGEVEEEPELHPCETQVGQKLLLMGICHRLDRLQFQDDLPVHDDISAGRLIKAEALVSDGNGDLPLCL